MAMPSSVPYTLFLILAKVVVVLLVLMTTVAYAVWLERKVVARIEQLFPDQVKTLCHVTVTPVKAALRELSAGDLARLGVRVVDSDDEVVIKPADGDIDKLVAALLADDDDEEDAA